MNAVPEEGPSYNRHPAALRAGRFITDQDVAGRNDVAVLGTTVIENLLGYASINPETILLNRV